MPAEPRAAVDLYWLPLGAGGHFVRMNGRIYEALVAWRARRPRRDLYHSALSVTVPAGRFVIEQAWPIPSGEKGQRGVVAEGPVATRAACSPRFLRYEVRRWRDGVISDINEAVASPQRLTGDVVVAERLLALVPEVPTPVWGRDEMPADGRAPGWDAGVILARRQETAPDVRQSPIAALNALPRGIS